MKYLCRIKETLVRTVVVEADSNDEAEDKLRDVYDEGKIMLDGSNYSETEFFVLEQSPPEDFEIDIK